MTTDSHTLFSNHLHQLAVIGLVLNTISALPVSPQNLMSF